MSLVYRAVGSIVKGFGVLSGALLFMGLLSTGFRGGIPLLIVFSLSMLWIILWWLLGSYLQNKHKRMHGQQVYDPALFSFRPDDTRVTVHPVKRFIGRTLMVIAAFIGIGVLIKAYHVIEYGDRVGRAVIIATLVLWLCWRIGWHLSSTPSKPNGSAQ